MLDSFSIPPLAPGLVQLWHAHVAEVRQDLTPLLMEDERRRAGRFLFEANRSEFVVGRALVRLILAGSLEVGPDELQFRSGPFGKPSLECAGQPPIYFNVSHSAGLVVAAFLRERELGVDVEDADREVSPAVMQNVFTSSERESIASLQPGQRRAAAVAQWTLKEAWLKARGDGLNLPLLEFAIDRAAAGSPRISFSDAIVDDPARWHFHQTRFARHIVSLAVADSRPRVEHHDFASLLNLQTHHDSSRQPLVAVG